MKQSKVNQFEPNSITKYSKQAVKEAKGLGRAVLEERLHSIKSTSLAF